MRPSRVLARIRAGKVARVLKLNTTSARVAEIFAASGPDALWTCMEHVSTSFGELDAIVRAAKLHDVDTLVRVPRGSYSDYVRGLEVDAAGLIVPHVLGAADARTVRDATKFPPVGRRALDGGNADGGYTRVPLADYLAGANSERVVLHQIEDPEAVDDIEEIAAMEGVDGLFFGPGDYSLALGIPGALDHAKVDEVRRRVARAARDAGKIAATVCPRDQTARYADMGYNLLNVGADVHALRLYAEAAVESFGEL